MERRKTLCINQTCQIFIIVLKKQKNQRYIIFVKYVEGEHFYFFFCNHNIHCFIS